MEEKDKFYKLLENGNEEEIRKFLVSRSPKIWDYKYENDDGNSILHIAASQRKNYSIMQTLIEYIENNNQNLLKAFINKQNNLGITPLHYASFCGNLNIVKLLINKGADVTIKSNQLLNVIHYSSQTKNSICLIYYYLYFNKKEEIEEKDEIEQKGIKLKKNSFEFFINQDKDGNTPLHWAAYSDSKEALLCLLNLDIFENENERKKFIDLKDNKGYTALHKCVLQKNDKLLIKLLQNGATPDIKDNLNLTPYQLAIANNLHSIGKKIKDYQDCQVCKLIPPIKKNNKNKKNILLLFLCLITSFFIMIFSALPIIALKDFPIIEEIFFYSYLFLLLLFLFLYLLLLMINPGAKTPNNLSFLNGLIKENNDNLKDFCYKCFILDKETKHCIICEKCYSGFSHHCYWINKCVAKKNYCLFIIFLIEAFIYLLFILIVNILVAYKFCKNEFKIKIDDDFLENNESAKFFHLGANIFLLLLDLIFIIPEVIFLVSYLSKYRPIKIFQKRESNINKYLLPNDDTLDEDE